jgi:hypothetical protein
MTDNKQNHHLPEGQDYIKGPSDHIPRWKQFHHSWIFWIFLFLMLIGIFYYIVSVDFILTPRR